MSATKKKMLAYQAETEIAVARALKTVAKADVDLRNAGVHALHFAAMHGTAGYLNKLLALPDNAIAALKTFLLNANRTYGTVIAYQRASGGRPAQFVVKTGEQGKAARQAMVNAGIDGLAKVDWHTREKTERMPVEPLAAIEAGTKAFVRRLKAEYPNSDPVRWFIADLEHARDSTMRAAKVAEAYRIVEEERAKAERRAAN